LESAYRNAGRRFAAVLDLILDVEPTVTGFFRRFEPEDGQALEVEEFAAGGKHELLSLEAVGSLLDFIAGLQQRYSEDECPVGRFPERDAFEF